MELNQYKQIWQKAHPAMLAMMTKLHALLAAGLPSTYTLTAPAGDEGGDEWKVSLDIKQGDVVVLGLDFTLVDGGMAEDSEGVGVSLSITGYGGLAMGGYFPENYTDDVWTTDADEVLDRINNLPEDSLADYVLTQALVNPVLLQALTSQPA